MRIGVCDDNITDRRLVSEWLAAKRPAGKTNGLFEFSCGEALLEHLRRESLDLLFLDGRMDGLNGIQTARKIREYDKDMLIIVLSDYLDFAVDGYGVDVFDYVLKKDFQRKMPTVLEKAVRFVNEREQAAYTVKLVNNMLHVRVVEILYIESKLRKLKMALRDGKTHEYYGKLDNTEWELKQYGFIRTHKSFLINGRYIRHFEYANVELDNGVTLPVSRGYYKPALDAFTLYAAEGQ